MKIESTALAMITALGLISGACSTSSGGSTGTGGTPSTSGGAVGSGGSSNGGAATTGGAPTSSGGSGGSGGAVASCTNVTACGGNVVGTWNVASSCLKVSGKLDVSAFGLDPNCMATVSGSLQVTGSWTAKADGTYTDNTTTSGTEQIEMSAVCLNLSGTTTTCDRISAPFSALGYSSVTCTQAATGGCTCTGTVQQTGGLGIPSPDPQTSGNYTTANNTLTNDGAANFPYCVAGGTLTLTPQPMSPTTTGTVVLQNGTTGAGGSGGSGGSGGASSGGSGGMSATGGSGGSGGATTFSMGPCDIYGAASTPCAAAYSMVRRLSSKYSGPLYQVRKGGGSMNTGTGGTTMDIGATASGLGDAAAQDTFCGTDSCTVSKLYDQSGNANDLKVAPAGCYNDGSANTPDYESNAKGRSLTVSGHKVYALYTIAHEGYRNNATKGMPLGSTSQGIYEIADGKRIGAACCWDFGSAGTDNCNGSVMNTIFFGTGFWGKGAGNGPWFLGDFEGGVWAGGSGASNAVNMNNPSMNVDYAFGVLKTSSGQYAIRTANASSGGLTTAYDGNSPKQWNNKGAVILGIGGDNSNHSQGTFFEGAVTNGRPSDATDAAVLANVQAIGYGK